MPRVPINWTAPLSGVSSPVSTWRSEDLPRPFRQRRPPRGRRDHEVNIVENGCGSGEEETLGDELRATARRMTVGQGEHVNPSKQHAERTKHKAHNDGDLERGQNERPPRTRRYSTSVVGLLSRHI